jgi:hypothetical protein
MNFQHLEGKSNDELIQVYLELYTRAKNDELSLEEVKTFSQLTTKCIEMCWEEVLRLKSEHYNLRDSLLYAQEVNGETELINKVCMEFLEERDLIDDFHDYLISSIELSEDSGPIH